MDRNTLERKPVTELREIASALDLSGYQRMKKADLVDLIVGQAGDDGPSTNGSGSGDDGDGGSGRERTRERTRERDEDDTSGGGEDDGKDDGSDGGKDDDGDDDRGGRNKNRRRKSRGGGGGGGQDQGLEDAEVREGVLDLLPEGYGFLRTTGYLSGALDVYVSQSYVRRFNLRRGDKVKGPIRQNNRGSDKFPALARIDEVDGHVIENENDPYLRQRTNFSDLTPLFPDERLSLETEERSPISMRIVDMMVPIGKGQRGLIVSPPKAGKTTILKQIAHAVETNAPDVHLMVLLVDERPEEVTDFERSTSGEVISSTFDRPAEDHTQVAELCLERAKRLVERGRDVVVLLDSITRLGRAYNLAVPASGRILSGGIDSAALYPPKRFFGAARNIEDGGSLTIIATALIETGSKMDEVIFEEFKGTGNMELRLDRRMEQKRIFPAIDIQASGTRREELLLGEDELEVVWKLRRLLSSMDSDAALQLLIDKLRATKSNEQFLSMIAKSNLGG
jgi:transcription termination factor Rho